MARSRRYKNKPLTLVAYSVAILLGIGGLSAVAVNSIGKPVADKLGCYDVGEQAHTLVFADASEPRWNEEQQRSLSRYFSELFYTLGFNERFSLFTTEGDQIGSVIAPRFTLCGGANHPDELTVINAEPATQGYLLKDKQRRFDKHFAPEIDTLLSLTPDESRQQWHQSPVLETLQALSRRPEMHRTRKLVVISDLLQNSETARFCVKQGDMPAFKHFVKRGAYQRIKPERFDGVEIEILMLQRYGYGGQFLPYCHSEEEIRDFYRDYFTYHGATSVRFTRLRAGYTQE